MNFNGKLINILIEFSAGIVSGFLIELLIDIVAFIILYFSIGVVFVLYPFMTPGIAQNPESSFFLENFFWLVLTFLAVSTRNLVRE